MYRRLLFPLLTLLEPEISHELALTFLRLVRLPGLGAKDPRLETEAFGLRFANPIGLAAGFDKNGVAARGVAALGFGHVEVGTITPRPQPGKPKPRLFRLKADRALINRLGFPSQGMDAVAANLRKLNERRFVLGANVGPNADSVGVEDFRKAAKAVAPYVDYLTVNVSSPNTAGLRDMQAAGTLESLLRSVTEATSLPVLVKIAPDLSEGELAGMLAVIQAQRVAGIVATNTTVKRPASLKGSQAGEAGGLSGEPLRQRSTEVVRAIYRQTEGALPIVAAGGVATWQDVIEKLQAGASLVQLYTGFVYEGPLVARSINQGLLRWMDQTGVRSLAEVTGQKA